MKINIRHIPAEGLEMKVSESASTFPRLAEMVQNNECDFIVPIEVAVRIDPYENLFKVRGKFRTRVRVMCSRCLDAAVFPLEEEFEWGFGPKAAETVLPETVKEVELTADELGRMVYEGGTIDLTDAIQDQVKLAFPMRPLCSDLCKGLCPNCGENLNAGACGCSQGPKDTPFAILEKLRHSS